MINQISCINIGLDVLTCTDDFINHLLHSILTSVVCTNKIFAMKSAQILVPECSFGKGQNTDT